MEVKKNKILVAVDGSNQSLDAVRYVSKMLTPKKTDVVLFNVMRKIKDAFRDVGSNPTFHSKIANISAWETTQGIMIQKFMNEARKVLMDGGFPEDSVIIKVHECDVGVARDIIRESNNGYRAVVVGRRGLSSLMDIMMGSVAYKLMEKLSHVPVWIVGGTPWPGKVLLGLDSSQGAMRAVDHVGVMLDGMNTEVNLLNVLRSPNIFHPEIDDIPPAKQKEIHDHAKEEIDPVFEKASNALTKAGFVQEQISTELITGVGSRAGTIVEEAKRRGCGTIVIGRRGISKVEEFFMGRVSNKVINLARDMAVWIVN